MSTRDNLLQFAKELADPDWSLSVPKIAKDTIASLLQVIEDSKPRPINTIEEVDALPDKTIVRTRFGDAVTIYRDNPGLPVEHYHFLLGDGSPATILYEPGKVTD